MYAIDSDATNLIYSVSNAQWVGQNTNGNGNLTIAANAQITNLADDFAGAVIDGDGALTANYTVLD